MSCRAALACATASSADVGTVCVHGTGTPLGDPIEVGALGQGLKHFIEHSSNVQILSNKACFGHTEGTAGLSGAVPTSNAEYDLLHTDDCCDLSKTEGRR